MAVRNIERELEALTQQCASEPVEVCAGRLRKALHDKVNLVPARAASLIAKRQISSLVPDLCTAFERMLVNAIKTDPKCWGKEAIVKALKDLGHAESGIFQQGLRHVQWEPVWGGQEDTAATLRATCALALVQCSDLTREDKIWAVMRLLSERSPTLRKDGALGLEMLEGREAAFLLRLKARMGDEDPSVSGQVFESLLQVEKDGAVPSIAEFLQLKDGEIRQEAALALGASRLVGAVSMLIDVYSGGRLPVDLAVFLRALSISRSEQAIDFLCALIARGRIKEATAALESLEVYRASLDIREKVRHAVESRAESELRSHFEQIFCNP